MKIKSLREIKDLSARAVLLRCDFNVPLEKGQVRDDFRLRTSLADIKYLLAAQAKVVLATHLGDPKGRDMKLSTKLLVKNLESILGTKIFFSSSLGKKLKKEISQLKPGSLMLLENLRFQKGEKDNDLNFAKKLAEPFDYYINNAFSVCHRRQASVSAIKKYLPSFAGLFLEQEVLALEQVIKSKKPLVLLMGGKKISTKAPLIKRLYSRADKIILGGALANTFLKAKGLEIGKSFFDKEELFLAKNILKLPGADKKIVLPSDVVTAQKLNRNFSLNKKTMIKIKAVDNVFSTEAIMDIGPESIRIFAGIIKKAKTLVWNGPFGLFEISNFRQGTIIIARLVGLRSSGRAYGVSGGGETVEAINLSKVGTYFDWVSTGGGAMLDYLAGAKMPGLEALVWHKK